MIRSMTGYGRSRIEYGSVSVTVEVKSVNNRYLDVSVRLPRAYLYMEEKIKKLCAKYISRGKIDLFVTLERTSSDNVELTVDDGILSSYIKLLGDIKERYGLSGEISLSTVVRNPDIFGKITLEEDEEEAFCRVEKTLRAAFEAFTEMRTVEGENLKSDILLKLTELESMVSQVEELSRLTVDTYASKLQAKIREVLENREVDESRLLTEVAIFADKVAVDEETTRLRSHISQYRQILSLTEPVGKKLDFLTQELNREVNTIGSKCSDMSVTKLVVGMKSLVEKIREQIQNIE